MGQFLVATVGHFSVAIYKVSSGGGIVIAVEVVTEAGLRVIVVFQEPEIIGNRFYLYPAVSEGITAADEITGGTQSPSSTEHRMIVSD